MEVYEKLYRQNLPSNHVKDSEKQSATKSITTLLLPQGVNNFKNFNKSKPSFLINKETTKPISKNLSDV